MAGQLAFSRDGATMYVPLPSDHTVLAVTPDGTMTPYATGLVRPLGLLVTDDGLPAGHELGRRQESRHHRRRRRLLGRAARHRPRLGAAPAPWLADGRVLVSDQQTGNLT
ncbi:MAG: hypothetical protein R3F59_10970 [Myxococcota bacterium]